MGVLGTGRIHNAIKVVCVFGVCGIAVYALADYGIAVSMQVTSHSAVSPSVWDWGVSGGRLSK